MTPYWSSPKMLKALAHPEPGSQLLSATAETIVERSSDHPNAISAAFAIKDSAARFPKAIVFSSKCQICLNRDTGSITVQHLDHASDPSWRFVFPILSQIKRLNSCHHCHLSESGPVTFQCDDGFPCLACQYRNLPCVPRPEPIPADQAIDGDAEMQLAAEEAALLTACLYGNWNQLFTLDDDTDPFDVHDGYIPQTPTHNRTPRNQPLQRKHVGRILYVAESPTPEASPLAGKHRSPQATNADASRTSPSPSPTANLRRSARLKRRPSNLAPYPSIVPPTHKLSTADFIAKRRVHGAHVANLSPIVGYAKSTTQQQQQPPPWIALGSLELTMAEIAVFLLNLAHRPECAARLVANGWTAAAFCAYHNWARGCRGETRARGGRSEGALRSTFTRSVQRSMRLLTGDPAWVQARPPHEQPAPTTDLGTAGWAPLVSGEAPAWSLRAMGAGVVRWPPEEHSLNLTRAVRFAVEHPEVPEERLRFPTHVREVVQGLPGGFRVRAAEAEGEDDNLDRTIIAHWEDFQERQERAV